jgi:hypothetical protein
MPEEDEDILAGTHSAHSNPGEPGAAPALRPEAALAALDLDESGYLANVGETLKEWAGPEDEVAFSKL